MTDPTGAAGSPAPGAPGPAPVAAPLALAPDLALRLERSGLSVVVTGAGGWLGRATLEMLEGALGASFGVRVHAFGSAGRVQRLRSGTTVVVRPVGELDRVPHRPHLLLHHAFVTRDRLASLGPRAFVAANRELSDAVAAHAARADVAGIFVPSSGAVYGTPGGTVDPYGMAKRDDEERFSALATGRPLVVMRVFNLAGPFINKPGAYVLASVVSDVLSGGPVRLTADHPVVRSYVHVGDVLSLALSVLTAGPAPDGPFDTAGECEVEVGELAQRAVEVCGRPGTVIERPPLLSDVPDRYVGDGAAWWALAARHAVVPADLGAQLRDTAGYLRGPQPPG